MIDFDNICEIYGDGVLGDIMSYKDNFFGNIDYFEKLGFSDAYYFAENFPFLFLLDFDDFKYKVDRLILSLGDDYVDKIENDLDLLEEII